jgi:hypothetical protein
VLPVPVLPVQQLVLARLAAVEQQSAKVIDSELAAPSSQQEPLIRSSSSFPF